MTRTDLVHRAFAGFTLIAVLSGLNIEEEEISLNIILFIALLVALRVKFWFDDESYFEEVNSGKQPGGLPFGFGFVMALISWFIWIGAGYQVKNIELSSLLMIFVLLPSTIWIIAAMVKQGAYAEQIPWLFFNAFYALGFYLIYSRESDWNIFKDNLDTYTLSAIIFLLVVFFFDLVATRILEQKRKASQ